jgi:hypothetical protein
MNVRPIDFSWGNIEAIWPTVHLPVLLVMISRHSSMGSIGGLSSAVFAASH